METKTDSERKIDLPDGRDIISADNADTGDSLEQMDAEAMVFNLSDYAEDDYLTKAGMCQAFKCTQRTVQRMVDRFEIPPPMPLAGRNVWIVGKLKAWIANAADRLEGEALKEAKRMNYIK